MLQTLRKILTTLFAVLCLFLAAASAQDTSAYKKIKVPRTVWNFDGGIFFDGEGGVYENTCFRVAGHLSAPQFFDDFKRFDSEQGTEYRSGNQVVTQFPSRLLLILNIYDFPCSSQLQNIGTRAYLTRETMSTLDLSLYWKHGVELRPVSDVTPLSTTVTPMVSYEGAHAHQLPGRLKWTYQLGIPGDGVPLTDNLALIIRTKDGRIAARVAARL
jgi:hypothetical protein